MVASIFGSADLTSPNGIAKLINELITKAGFSEDDNFIQTIEKILPEVIVNLNASCESYLSEFATYVDS